MVDDISGCCCSSRYASASARSSNCVRVYLAGPINGCTDDEANGWRVQAKRMLVGYTVLDPMERDYRGRENNNVSDIVQGDKGDILYRSDVVLANAARPSWGTAMEVLFAWERGVRVMVIVPKGQPVSPWLRFHSTSVEHSLEDALAVMGTW